jgi:hypothetical protein
VLTFAEWALCCRFELEALVSANEMQVEQQRMQALRKKTTKKKRTDSRILFGSRLDVS